MEPDTDTGKDNPIPSHDPRKTVKVLVIASALLLLLTTALVLANKPTSQQPDQDQAQTVDDQPATAQVEITKDGFIPATLFVAKGTTVTWTNTDSNPHPIASNPHPEHTTLPGLDSKDVISIEGGTYSFTFDTPGEYTYHDHLNPTTNGTIMVE